MKCQQGRPKRSSRGTLYEETWPETDRNYWHPCTKNWAGQCRGRPAHSRGPGLRGTRAYAPAILTARAASLVAWGTPHMDLHDGLGSGQWNQRACTLLARKSHQREPC